MSLSIEPNPLLLASGFCFGAVIGSFLNVCIHRLPLGESVVSPGSRCPGCGHEIRWWENIPLLSYLFLRGRCSGCGTAISPRYPAVEMLSAGAAVALLREFGLAVDFFVYYLFTAMLIIVIFTDLEHRIIPDEVSLSGIVVGFCSSFLVSKIGWIDSLLGIVAGGGSLFAVAWGYYLLMGKVGMGGGDIKLLAMIGAFLGWKAVPMVIFLSAFAGSVIGGFYLLLRRDVSDRAIPYGPFLAVAAIATLFWGEELWNLYWKLLV